MTRVRVAGFSISLDGFGAGPEQSLENPLGKRGLELHEWIFGTRMFREMTGQDGGSNGIDQAYAHRSMEGFGAFILGRNMFGPIRGPWPAESWKGWWGNNPPYHAPTFVLTHHPRDPIEMEGGTTFIFVTDGIEAALEKAKRAAKGRDVKIGGGVEGRVRLHPVGPRRERVGQGRRGSVGGRVADGAGLLQRPAPDASLPALRRRAEGREGGALPVPCFSQENR
jgi:dihydrofolate reductase